MCKCIGYVHIVYTHYGTICVFLTHTYYCNFKKNVPWQVFLKTKNYTAWKRQGLKSNKNLYYSEAYLCDSLQPLSAYWRHKTHSLYAANKLKICAAIESPPSSFPNISVLLFKILSSLKMWSDSKFSMGAHSLMTKTCVSILLMEILHWWQTSTHRGSLLTLLLLCDRIIYRNNQEMHKK